MKVFIFPNHRLHEASPRGPVVRVEKKDGTFCEGNDIVIQGPSRVRFSRRGLRYAREHRVRVWIEANEADLIVR